MSEEKKPAREARAPAAAEEADAFDDTRIVIEVRTCTGDGAGIVDMGAGHSLAQLFEGSVQTQLQAANILAATTARCVNMILTGGARERAAEREAMIREDR